MNLFLLLPSLWVLVCLPICYCVCTVLALHQKHRSHSLHVLPLTNSRTSLLHYPFSPLYGSFLSVCKHITYPIFKNEKKNPFQFYLFLLQLPISFLPLFAAEFLELVFCTSPLLLISSPFKNSLNLTFPSTLPMNSHWQGR